QASGQGGRLRRARLALDEAARDLARGVHALLELHREGEEVEAGPGIGPVGGAEHKGVAVADRDGPTGEPGKRARLDGQRATTEFCFEFLSLSQRGTPPVSWRRRRPAGRSADWAMGAGCDRTPVCAGAPGGD